MIDYEVLLKKYMGHVMTTEGTTAVPGPCHYDPPLFTEEEWLRLEAMADEVEAAERQSWLDRKKETGQ